MFDITPDDIKRLNDIHLRELVGRLCEAELASRGFSASAATWGGSQTAPDGGLDVRVQMLPGQSISGFIPRPRTGFQVKTPDLAEAAILDEMRPTGVIRPVIQELADGAGAYVIVSSSGSTTDLALQRRHAAMREALAGVANAEQLQTDFYDRTRLATWVRCHPGLVIWVRQKVGRVLDGWRPYGPWSGDTQDSGSDYLLDDKLRLNFHWEHSEPARSVANAIDDLRDNLIPPGRCVRLIGLSGVGKTRLAQALFDTRVGTRPLATSLAVYTDLSDGPSPQPLGLAEELIAHRRAAVLIVDNCPSGLHRRLADLCRRRDSTVSVLTVEYDVRDDVPEGTQVVRLCTASPALIEKLVQRRFEHLSRVDAGTISQWSDGNARLAIALASTLKNSDTLVGLSDEDLIQRLIQQRHEPDAALLRVAQVCSLFYSFEGETLSGQEGELPILAKLVGQEVEAVYASVAELHRRGLVQQRGVWRAVLPHALANRLAARALEDLPPELIHRQLVLGGTARLLQSFSRRLSFLPDHPRAIEIADSWLAQDGLLGDVSGLNELGQAMFENIASVLPPVALAALARVGSDGADGAALVWSRHESLLRSLAFDPPLFEGSAQLLARAATQCTDERAAKSASESFVSLFGIFLSGTHAPIEQRLGIVERLLRSSDKQERALGVAGLERLLKTEGFSSDSRFEFGGRSRDFGYKPQSPAGAIRWYLTTLSFIERMAESEVLLLPELRGLLARNFRSLWAVAPVQDDLERLCRTLAAAGFWRDGWAACRLEIQLGDHAQSPSAASRLSALELTLRPSNLSQLVRAFLMEGECYGLDLEDLDLEQDPASPNDRSIASARKLGVAVAEDAAVLTELVPDLLRGGNLAWELGCGVAKGVVEVVATWVAFIEVFRQIPAEERSHLFLGGFLGEVWRQDRNVAQSLLDSALEQPDLLVILPLLQSAVLIDERGVERLKYALNEGQSPAWMCGFLAFGRATDHLASVVLKDLLLHIAAQPDGVDVALRILFMRLLSGSAAVETHAPELLEAARELLQRVVFRKGAQRRCHELVGLVEVSLASPDAGPLAARITNKLLKAVADREAHAHEFVELLRALLKVQPRMTLDALFYGEAPDRRIALSFFELAGDIRGNPADAISVEALVAWCDVNQAQRYALVASIVSFAIGPGESGQRQWSEQSKALLARAPDPRVILGAFIERFQPAGGFGSLAMQIEANAQLLDKLEPLVPPSLMPYVAEAKASVAQEVARVRQWETRLDRARDERFE